MHLSCFLGLHNYKEYYKFIDSAKTISIVQLLGKHPSALLKKMMVASTVCDRTCAGNKMEQNLNSTL